MTSTRSSLLTPSLLLALLAGTAHTNAFQQCSRLVTVRKAAVIDSSIYIPSQQLQQQTFSTTSTQLFMAKKKGQKKAKGFGEAPPAPTKKETSADQPFTAPMATTPEPSQKNNDQGSTMAMQSDVVTQDRPGTTRETEMNMGQKALQQMRREEAERKDAELRRVKEMRDTDKMLQTKGPEAAAIPEKVAMRMGKRMLPFVGIPLFGSMGAFVAFWYFATYKNVEFEPGMVAASTIVILVSGLVGITYSIISASWDEDREGSLLGVEEFQKNVGNIKEGLDRSKDNLVLREKMAGLPEKEIEAALVDLDRREKKRESFASKMGQELEK